MIELIDVKKESEIVSLKRKRELFGFAVVSFLFIGGVALGIVFSKDDYVVLLWLLILAMTFYIWGTLYFFSVPYKRVCRYDRFYRGALQGLISEEIVEFVSFDPDKTTSKDGIEARQVIAEIHENGKIYERDFYLLEGRLNLAERTRIKVESFSGVLLSYEVLP
jgi:hypothetical protein